AKKQSIRDAVFRRLEPGRDGRSIGSVTKYSYPGLEFRPGLAAPGTGRCGRNELWIAGRKLNLYSMTLYHALPRNAMILCARAAAAMSSCSVKSDRCSRIMNHPAVGSLGLPRRRRD